MAQLFETILQISLSTAAVIGVLLLLVPLWQKRYSARWRKAIWLIIAVRLLIPFSLELPQTPVQMNVDLQATPAWQAAVTDDAVTDGESVNTTDNAVQTVNHTAQDNGAVVSDVTVAKETQISRGELWALVWMVGAVVFLLAHGAQYAVFRRRVLCNAQPLPEQETVLQQASDGLNLRHYPNVLLSSKAHGPMLIGFVRSAIILPERIYGEKELLLILRHELVHYQQHDLWYKLVLLVANAVHWFNPLVYLMNRQANHDVEQVCDDKVVANQDMDYRKAYSMTILQAMSSSRGIALSTYLSKDAQNSKKRFADILYPQKYKRGLLLLCVVIIAAVGVSGCLQIGADTNEVDAVALYEQVASWLPEGAIENPENYSVMATSVEKNCKYYVWREKPMEVETRDSAFMADTHRQVGEKFYEYQHVLNVGIDMDSQEIIYFEYQNTGKPLAAADGFVPFYEDTDAAAAYRNQFLDAFIPDTEQLKIWNDKNWGGAQAQQPKYLCYQIRDEQNHYNYEVRLQTETGYVSYYKRDYYNKEWRKEMMNWLAEQYKQNLGEVFNFPANEASAGNYWQYIVDGQYRIQPVGVDVYWQPKMTTTMKQKLEQLRQTNALQYATVQDSYQSWYHDETMQLYMTADITWNDKLDLSAAQLYYHSLATDNIDADWQPWQPWDAAHWQWKENELQIKWAAASYARAYCDKQREAMALFGKADNVRFSDNAYELNYQSELIKRCELKSSYLDGSESVEVQVKLQTTDNSYDYLTMQLAKVDGEWQVAGAWLEK